MARPSHPLDEFIQEYSAAEKAFIFPIHSPHGLAIVERKIPEGRTLDSLLDKYASKKFGGKKFSQLTKIQKNSVFYEIIKSSGRDNIKFSTGVRRLQIIGVVGIVITAALATHEIINSDNKIKEAIRQSLGIGGGIFGGFLAGLSAVPMCGPAAPICAVAVVLAGTVAGGATGSYIANTLDEEIEEFSKWMIN